MSRLARFTVGALFALFAGTAVAHPNHGDGPPVTKEELQGLSARVVARLVEGKQLAPSWQGRPAKEVSSRETPAGLIWIVSYENPAEADKAKRTVYMFFDEFGNFIGGNHSGKFQ